MPGERIKYGREQHKIHWKIHRLILAIEYGSSLHAGGINLAVFNDEKLEVNKIELHEVVSVDLDTKLIKVDK